MKITVIFMNVMPYMEAPVISVIVPIYNANRYLENCISSVLDQSFSNFELILINDGSTDNSKAICDRKCREDERLRLISYMDNQGVSFARNKGIDSAVGKYLFFLDSDDMIHPNLLEAGLREAESAGADMVLFERFFSDKHSIPEWTEFCAHPLTPEWHTPSEEELWEVWRYLKRRYDVGGKLFLREAVGPLRFEEQVRTSEDFLFNYSFLIDKPRRISYTDLEGYYYRVRVDSVWHNLQLDGLLQTLRARRRIIESELAAGREENAVFDEQICLDVTREWYALNGKEDKTIAADINNFFKEEENQVLFQKLPRTKRWGFYLYINYPGLYNAIKSVQTRRSDNRGERA